MPNRPPRLAIYLPDFRGGGVERVALVLADTFVARGLDVRIVVHSVSGPLGDELPDGVRLVSLEARRTLAGVFKLAAHLRSDPPDILLSNLGHNNIVALWARALARARGACGTRVVICQHNALSAEVEHIATWQYRVLPWLYRRFGAGADAIVGVSDGVCNDMAAVTGLQRTRFSTLYNPVIDKRFSAALARQASRRAPASGEPWTVLGMGRLVPQKDFPTLIRAFALIPDPHARLVIAGVGPDAGALQRLTGDLGLTDRVRFAGFVKNPVELLSTADVFVLSSRYEGLGNVLIEALACQVPVVSTDCPHGPAEILRDGADGLLVPVGNAAALAQAIRQQRDAPRPSEADRVARAKHFHVDVVADRYLALFADVLGTDPAGPTAA